MNPENFNFFVISRARYPAFSFPNLIIAVGLCRNNFKNKIGHKLSYAGFILKNNKRTGFIGEKKDINILINKTIKKILNNKNFIKNQHLLFNKRKKELLDFTRNNLIPKKIKSLPNKELYFLLKEYYKKYENLGLYAAQFMYYAIEPLEKEIKKRIKPEHEFLLISPEFSYSTKYELDYFKKCLKIAKQLHKKWGWIIFDYLGPDEWDEEFFLNKLGADIEKSKEIKEKNILLRKKQKRILNNYNQKTVRLIKDFHILSKMQDNRKGIATISHVYLQKYLYPEISKRTAIETENFIVMTPSEIKQALSNKKFDNSYLTKRKKQCLILFHNNKFSVHENDKLYKKAIKLMPHKKEIKGIIASKGKVKGIVKICLTSKDISKVKKGDILVAPMTTPNYVSAMSKASGFITDEGGITSHAAVIAREMNKPCIIGTHSATDLLKDGDLIELDADKGIIKKIYSSSQKPSTHS